MVPCPSSYHLCILRKRENVKDGKEKINNQVKSFYTNDISETNKVINKTIYNMIKQS